MFSGDKIIATILQVLLILLILYVLYFNDKRLAYFLLILILVLTIWKQYMMMSYPTLCDMAKKIHC